MSSRESRALALLRLAVRRVIGRHGRTALLLLAIVMNYLLVLLACTVASQATGELEHVAASGSFGLTDIEINRTRLTSFSEDQLAAIRAWPNVACVFVGRSDDCRIDDVTSLVMYKIDPLEAARCRVYHVSRGRYLQPHDTRSIVVGEAFAASRKWHVGDELLLGAGADKTAYTITGLASEYGLVLEGEARRGVAFICAPVPAKQGGDASFLLVRLVDRACADETVAGLRGYLGPGYPVRRTKEAGDSRFAEISLWVGRALLVVTTTAFGIMLFVSAVLAIHLGRDDVELRTLWRVTGLRNGGAWILILIESGLMATLGAGLTMAVGWLGSAISGRQWFGVLGNTLPSGRAVVWLALLWVGTWGALALGRHVGMVRGGRQEVEEPCCREDRRRWSLVSIVLGALLLLSMGLVLRNYGRSRDVTSLIWTASGVSLLSAGLLAYGLGDVTVRLARRILKSDSLRVRLSPLGLAVSVVKDGRVAVSGLIGCTTIVLALGFLLQTAIRVLLRAEESASANVVLLSFRSGTPDRNAVLLEKIGPAVKRVPVTMAPMQLDGLGQIMVAGIPYGSVHAYRGLFQSREGGKSLSEHSFRTSCLLSGSIALEHHIGRGDSVSLQRGEIRVALKVLALLPPTAPAGSIVCDARLLHDRFGVRGPTHYLLFLPRGMTSQQATARLLATGGDLDRFRVQDLRQADAALVAILSRSRKWLLLLVGCLLTLGAAGAGGDVGLQSSLSRYQSHFREIGAPASRVIWEASLAVCGLVLVGTGIGICLGHVQAALMSRWLFDSLDLARPRRLSLAADESALALTGGLVVLVVSFLAILVVGRLRGPDTVTS